MPPHACERLQHLQLGKSPKSPPHTPFHIALGWEIVKVQHKPAVRIEKGAEHVPPFLFSVV